MSVSKRASIKSKSPLDAFIGKPTESASEAPAADAQTPTTNGETAKQLEPDLRQTTIMVYDEQLDWLDEKCIQARRKKSKEDKGTAIRKAAIIRALIDLARSSPVDLSGLKSEEELVDRFEQAIKSK